MEEGGEEGEMEEAGGTDEMDRTVVVATNTLIIHTYRHPVL